MLFYLLDKRGDLPCNCLSSYTSTFHWIWERKNVCTFSTKHTHTYKIDLISPISYFEKINLMFYARHFHTCEPIFLKIFFLVSTGPGASRESGIFGLRQNFLKKLIPFLAKKRHLFMIAISTIVNRFSWKYFSWYPQALGHPVKVEFLGYAKIFWKN